MQNAKKGTGTQGVPNQGNLTFLNFKNGDQHESRITFGVACTKLEEDGS